jgi:hypothetical protein
MNDSVKCLGFNELLKKEAETSREIALTVVATEYDVHGNPRSWCLEGDVGKLWVSVDVLKELSLSVASKERSLRKLLDKRPRFAFNREEWIDSTGESISDELVEYWLADFEKFLTRLFRWKKVLCRKRRSDFLV